jgi:hypothetical protein
MDEERGDGQTAMCGTCFVVTRLSEAFLGLMFLWVYFSDFIHFPDLSCRSIHTYINYSFFM